MSVYQYTAVNKAGEIESGRIEAATEAQAAATLADSSLLPIRLRHASGAFDWGNLWPGAESRAKPARRGDIVLITQQLAPLLRAGLTLDRALSVALQLAESPSQRRLIKDLLSRVRRGSSFTEALEAQAGAFPGYYISMVRAGEAGGALPDILGRLSQLLLRSQETRQKMLSALIYPAILLAMIGLTLVLILSFVLPRFEALFAEAGGKLPLPTRMVMGLGNAVQHYGLLMAAALALVVLLAQQMWRAPENRLRFDGWLLRRYWLGSVICKAESARFSRTLGTLIGGGMPMPASVRIAGGALYNRALRQAVIEVLQGVTEGQGFADQLALSRRFPALLIQMARVGEESGQLHEGLAQAAEILDADTQRTIERGLTVLVPVITVCMGAVVAALIGSVLMGILSINELAF